ncbi:hypothetical protein niasHT_017987 [Heterodera trifolii]|uniref:HAT C-terminal dimerisation domain-containing protein n=1 Tax=Heterodera trifolii TaxID=157864 RepID=A0ABD2LBN2_9BILA
MFWSMMNIWMIQTPHFLTVFNDFVSFKMTFGLVLNRQVPDQFHRHFRPLFVLQLIQMFFLLVARQCSKIPRIVKVGTSFFLTTPATSVCSERVFSKAGLLYANSLRNRLSGEMAQNLLIIKANMNKLFLGPSNNVDEEENDNENNENEAK